MRRSASSDYQYEVTISFANEDRQVAFDMANILKSRGIEVFYDEFKQADMWGKDLYEYLADVYTNRARYCIMLISESYARKAWTNHERRNAQARALREGEPYILPVRLDDTVIPGIPETILFVDLRTSSIEKIADLVEQKLGKVTDKQQSADYASSSESQTLRDVKIPMPAIRTKITQLDKDRYLWKSFDVMKEYFRRGSSALASDYAEIESDLIEIDARKFICKIYLHGEIKCQCKIWIGGFSKADSICYSEGRIEIDRDNSMNDWISVVENEGFLALDFSHLSIHSSNTEKGLPTHEKAAEYLWKRFTYPLAQ